MAEVLTDGQVFATRYRIERFLAKGGCGAVYVAEQLATEMRVALKVLWPHVLESRDAVEKFQQEARIAGRVNSEHIVRVVDAGFDAETAMPFLAMELLDGKDLDRLVREGAPLEPAVAAAYLRQVGGALDKAHRHTSREGVPTPIVHRDLKPENLFLCRREDGSPLVKVLDFGIAKVLSESTKMSQDVKGTPLYMAFEQLAGGAITPRTDVWPLGLIAFFLMSGRDYWKAAQSPESTLMLLVGEVLSQPIDPPSARLRELGATPPWPPAFDPWFLRCVNREVAKRFESAGEAVSALAAALESPADALCEDPALSATAFAPAPGPSGVVVAKTLPSKPPPSKVAAGRPRRDLAESTPATTLPARTRPAGLLMAAMAAVAVVAAAVAGLLWRQRSDDVRVTPIVSSGAAAIAPLSPAPPSALAPATAQGSSAPPAATPAASASAPAPPASPAAPPATTARGRGSRTPYDER
jgi:serine/threonine-protein kinase